MSVGKLVVTIDILVEEGRLARMDSRLRKMGLQPLLVPPDIIRLKISGSPGDTAFVNKVSEVLSHISEDSKLWKEACVEVYAVVPAMARKGALKVGDELFSVEERRGYAIVRPVWAKVSGAGGVLTGSATRKCFRGEELRDSIKAIADKVRLLNELIA